MKSFDTFSLFFLKSMVRLHYIYTVYQSFRKELGKSPPTPELLNVLACTLSNEPKNFFESLAVFQVTKSTS